MRSPLVALLLLCVVAPLLLLPMARGWAGDAVIHLRVAERLAQGHGWEFNAGQPVVATTSLGWSLLVAALFRLLEPPAVAWAVKAINGAAWAGAVLLTGLLWSRLYRRGVGLVAAALFALNPGIFQNSWNGMEAGLLALQHLLLFGLAFVWRDGRYRPALAFVLALGAALTRPEGALFAALLALFLLWRRRALDRVALALLLGTALGVASTAAVSWSVGQTLLPASGVARRAAGLRESVLLGPIALHPRSLVRFAAYWPLSLGLLASLRWPGGAAVRFALLLVAAMLCFYTFGIGATHTSRYWIPFFPFVMGPGVGGLVGWLEQKTASSARGMVLLVVLIALGWMATAYFLEYRERAAMGLGYPHHTIVEAVPNRAAFTAALLQRIGGEGKRPIVIAMQEVQLRYFLLDDGSIEIVSLDGRTTDFRPYLNPRTGARAFDRLLRDVRPDLVALHGTFQPSEPLLAELVAQAQAGSGPFDLDGFRFRHTGVPGLVELVDIP